MKITSIFLILSVFLVSTTTILARETTYKADIIVTVNKKSKVMPSALKFEEETFKVITNKPSEMNKEFNYSNIKAAEYSYAKKPILSTGGAIATAVLIGVFVVPLLFIKKKQHWLTVRTEDDFAVLKLTRDNYRNVLAEFETHGIKVETLSEDKDKK